MPPTRLRAKHHPDCYPSKEEQVLSFFRKAMALEDTEASSLEGRLVGIITPHIDFRVSLRAYAQAFAPLQRLPLASTYVILGVGHRSSLEWNLDRRDYLTPLGLAACDVELVDRLAAGLAPGQIFEPEAHEGEHSIEFALLWLQALHRLHGRNREFRFVPLLCGGLHRYVGGKTKWEAMTLFHRMAEALRGIMDERGEDVRVIVSIDGCHLGPRFGHDFRVDEGVLRDTASWEERLWEQVGKGNARDFLDWMRAEGNERYFDGVGALTLLLEARGGRAEIRRTFYEQWFTRNDASAVTFSSGSIMAR